MHYYLEVIMPPTDDVKSALETIMSPFSEHDAENRYAFWDWFVIGGRYSGRKLEATLGAEKLQQFYDWLNEEKVTVSAVVAGKQTLAPASQVSKVDAKWNEFFPQSNGEFVACPLFDHSGAMPLDICTVREIPPKLQAYRVIVARPGAADMELRVQHMCSTSCWNGVNWEDTAWDGRVQSALDDYHEYLDRCNQEYADRVRPQDDWLCVTVDYHC